MGQPDFWRGGDRQLGLLNRLASAPLIGPQRVGGGAKNMVPRGKRSAFGHRPGLLALHDLFGELHGRSDRQVIRRELGALHVANQAR